MHLQDCPKIRFKKMLVGWGGLSYHEVIENFMNQVPKPLFKFDPMIWIAGVENIECIVDNQYNLPLFFLSMIRESFGNRSTETN